MVHLQISHHQFSYKQVTSHKISKIIMSTQNVLFIINTLFLTINLYFSTFKRKCLIAGNTRPKVGSLHNNIVKSSYDE